MMESSCLMNAGLPSWFNLEQWLPAIFEVRGFCGESPEVFFGVSMAEALMPASIVVLIVTSLAALLSFFSMRRA